MGYRGASLTRIVNAAQMSKGALYYYFADKLDLFATVVGERLDVAGLVRRSRLLEAASGPEFWERMSVAARLAAEMVGREPRLIGLVRAFVALPPELRQQGSLSVHVRRGTEEVGRVFAHGQLVGAVRSDLPFDLVLAMWFSVQKTFDSWMLKEWENLGKDGPALMWCAQVDAMKRLLQA